MSEPIATPTPAVSTPPDWAHFELEVHCPRCGYNMRMLTGSRCPECGLDFDWGQIIAAAQERLESPLFEYQARKRPVRSLFATLWLAMRPRRLWKITPLALEPRVGLLLVQVALTGLIYSLVNGA